MKWLKLAEREARMRATEDAAWEVADASPLRDRYREVPRAPIRVIACPLGKEVNHGGLLRAAEAYRIERVDFSLEADGAWDGAANRGTRKWQPYRQVPLASALDDAESDGYRLVALTLDDRAVDVANYDWQFPTALVVGREKEGIAEEVRLRCADAVAIPLYGIVESLNVATATALALDSAIRAYVREHPDFLPARPESRRLVGGQGS
jgi:tRNA guanosine-2'-O-methyltransferase